MTTKTRKRRAIAAGAALISAATVLSISGASANVGTSLFEGNDGNTIVNTLGNKDWVNAPNLTVGTEQFQGQNDNSFTQGSKEDEVDVQIGLGSIPNSKADLGKFGVSSEVLPNGNVMMYLAWTRNDLSGTVNFDFEINQVAQPDMTIAPGSPNRSVHLNRTGDGNGALADDLLINYDLPPGGSPIPVLTIRKWATTEWGSPTTLNAGNSEGRINTAAVVFDGVSYPPAQFGEAAIDLTAAGIIPNQNDPNVPCVGFGSAYVKSRASSSFSATMKDFIAPVPLNLNTCGTIVIEKVTVPSPDPTNTSFPFTLTGGPSALNEAFSLLNGESFSTGNDVKAGSGYVAAETPIPAGWDLASMVCDNGTPANIVVVAGATTTCTFTNRARGHIIVDKVTNPSGSSQSFDFTTTGAGYAGFSLTDAATPNDSGALVPGSYSVAETPVTGWDNTAATCDGGNTPASITLGPGQTVHCSFTNVQRGTITVVKQTDPDGSAQVFDFTASYDADGFSLTDGQSNPSGPLVPGTYSVAETVPAGWTLTSATCSDGSPVTAIILGAGENITCTFNNQARGHIIVTKQTDPDGSPQVFDFVTTGTGYAGFSLTDGNFNDSGELVPGAYSVAETTPPGWENTSGVCDDVTSPGGTNPATLTLDPGETINCLFTNEENASITVIKNVDGPNPDNQSFSYTSNFGVTPLLDGGQFDSSSVGDLDPGTYNVTEDGVANWLLTNADPAGVSGAGGNVVCSDLSNSGAISLAAGEHVICTFVNERQVGAIRITKVRKHAAEGLGALHPHAGVAFNIHDNVTGGDIPVVTGADGTVCVDDFAFGTDRYTVTEGAHVGYADNVPVTLSVDNVSYCDGAYGGLAEVASFTNTPLTNVSINVDSQIDGGTKTVVVCNGVPVETNANGDLMLPFNNLPPTFPAVTLTCTITIDP